MLPILVLTTLLAPAPAAHAGPGDTYRVSLSHTGGQVGEGAYGASISEHGRFVAFEATSGFFVAGDTNGLEDVFLRDRELGTTVRVSAPPGGVQGNDQSRNPSISADGRFVAFDSWATNLVPGDTNKTTKQPYILGRDVFVWDRTDGTIKRVSVATGGVQANHDSEDPVISADGRYVAFTSQASNLVPNDTNGLRDAFIYDRKDQTTEVLSAMPQGGTHPYGDTLVTDLSEHGRYAALWSGAPLTTGDTNEMTDVFVRDRVSNKTTIVSVSSSGVQGNGVSLVPSISADGRLVAFDSQASNLVSGDTGTGRSGTDIFVHDGVTGATIRISKAWGENPVISDGGRYVLHNGIDPASPSGPGVGLVTDLANGNVIYPAINSQGQPANDTACSYGCDLSGSGQFVAFASTATNLVPDDTNMASDVFVHDNGEVYDVGLGIENLAPEQTWGGGDGPHAVNPSTYQSDPVNTATGAYLAEATDFRVPGVGVPLELDRTYTSADTSGGPLGQGWSLSLGAKLDVQENGDVVFETEDGQRVIYLRQQDGSFNGPPGGRSTLTGTESGYDVVRHDQVRYRFDLTGSLQYVLDRNGQGLTYGYTEGRLQTVTDAGGKSATFTYDAASNLVTRIDLSDGRHADYGYTAGLLTSATDVGGQTTSYTYDALGRMLTITDANNHVVITNEYGDNGRVSRQTDARGHVSTFAWNPDSQTSTMTDARGNAWKDVYSNNILLRQEDPTGAVTRYEYDSMLNVTKATDGRGNATAFTYDNRGNLLTKTAPSALWYEDVYRYDAMNNIVSHVDGRKIETVYTYDGAGNLVSEARSGSVTAFTRDPRGLVSTQTDPRGKVTAFEHDAAGNVTKVTSPLGHVTKFTYDSYGYLASKIDPRGTQPGQNEAAYTTTYTRDATGRLLSETDPLGNSTTYTYDAIGNRKTRVDAKNRTVTYTYDNANHVVEVDAPMASRTRYEYDATGNVSKRIDALNGTTTYSYDPANRLNGVISPSGRQWTYSYDSSGNRTKVVNPAGNASATVGDGTTSYSYDELNRLTKVTYSDATAPVTMAYDAAGNRVSMVDGAGTETYTYDYLNRLTKVTRGTNSFTYAYDAAGNMTRRTYPDATNVDYGYDADGRLTTATVGTAVTTYGYDPAGRLTSSTLPAANGHVESRVYDAAGRLTEVKNSKGATTLSRFNYSLDAVGNPVTITTNEGVTTYAYDGLDRVTEVCFAAACSTPTSPFIRWSYDAVGNRLTEARPAGTTSYSYDAENQLKSRTAPTGTTAYTYDGNGNQTAAGTRTFKYDLANRLTSTTQGSTTYSYTYDGDGKRLTTATGTTVNTKYFWDIGFAVPQLALERTGRDALLRRYTYGKQLLSMTAGTATYYYHLDGLGSVANVTSSTGAPQWGYTYEPFGAPRTETKVTTAAPVNPMRFTSALYEPETSAYHLRARQYDPVNGRFLQQDPIEQNGADPYVSQYAYVGNRPTVHVDPRGLSAESAGNTYMECLDYIGPEAAPLLGGGIGFVIGGVAGFFMGGPPGAAAAAYGGAAKGFAAGVAVGAASPLLCGIPAAASFFKEETGPQK